MVLQGRTPTGRLWRDFPRREDGQPHNLVTTRLLWLRGLEPGVNSGPGVDSYRRYIYIHGTNREDALGGAVSGGCVLLRDAEILDLYPRVPVGTHVWLEV
jgi:lipoprotein-anchoring transpeptidase ErfK/SrfK